MAGTSEKPTILLIDDLSKTARLIRLYLDNRVDVIATGSGIRGEEIARDKRPDLILLDIGLPDIDGLDLLERFGKDPVLAAIPVIMLTGLDDQARKQRAFSLGAHDYIVRPFEARELRSRIYGVLSGAISLRRIEESEHKYRTLVENLSTAVFQADASGTILFVNPAWETVTGYSVRESAGMDIRPLLFGQDEEGVGFAAFLEAAGTGDVFRSRREIRARDESVRFVKIAVTPFSINNTVFFEGTLEDITRELSSLAEKERLLVRISESNESLNRLNSELGSTLAELHETQSKLVAAERMKAMAMIVAGVRHEINNPNAAILSAQEEIRQLASGARNYFLSLIGEDERDSPAAEKLLAFFEDIDMLGGVIRQGAERIREIVSVMRAFIRHQEEGILTAGLDELLRLARTVFHYQYANIQVVIPDGLDTAVSANIGELNHAFLNLMLDAAFRGVKRMSFRPAGTDGGNFTLLLEYGDAVISPDEVPGSQTPLPDDGPGSGLRFASGIFRQNGVEMTVYPEIGIRLRFSVPLSK